jgi:myosin light chain 6
MDEQQLADCRDVFCCFDSKGDEKINVKQIGDVLRALGQNPTQLQIKKYCEHWSDKGIIYMFLISVQSTS